jgi:RNA polymerase sigma-70 factor, ECF subfamily
MNEGSLVDEADEPKVELSFEEFFRAEYPRLARALVLMTGSLPAAEDLAQEAWVRVYERWDRVRQMESPLGYVYRTAFNLNRKRLRRLSVALRNRLDPPFATDPLELVEIRGEVVRVVLTLPRGLREAIVLVEWLGLSNDEAGATLGIAAVSVRGRLHRAKTTLRERFGEDAWTD